MKIKILTLAILFVALSAMNVSAQNETDNDNKLHSPHGLFNHLSIGIHSGLAGSGIDVTMNQYNNKGKGTVRSKNDSCA